jgi:asparagine synthase (glutamine-hydrolysing)
VKKHISEVKNILIKSIIKKLERVKTVAVPFSGSLDSSILAHIIKKHSKTKPIFYTIGMEDCYDFKQSVKSAKLLQIKTKLIRVQDKEIKGVLKEYQKITKDNDKVSISYTLPFFILLKSIQEKDVITAHGADTLFGGFFKYIKYTEKEIKININKNFKEFVDHVNNIELTISRYLKKNLILPFLSDELLIYLMKLPPKFFIKENIRKYGLRKIAQELGLPDEISLLPKKAFQYSSGIIKPLRKYWKSLK